MSETSRNTLGGIALFSLGVLLFACMDTTTKYLAARYPAPMVVALRYIVQCVLMLAVLYPAQGRRLFRTRRTELVLVRACSLAIASLCLTLALQRMPVAESTAIVFISPMLVVLMAGPVLREYITDFSAIAALAGFAGVLLIARPGAGLDTIGVVLAVCAATANAIYQLLSRLLAATEETIALLFYTALVGAVGYGLMLPWFWLGPLPPVTHLGLFCATGVLGGVGHFLFTAAHRRTAASALAPLQYAQLIWACLLGWLVFRHVPDALGVLGMLVVAAAGMSVVVKSRLAARTLERAAEN